MIFQRGAGTFIVFLIMCLIMKRAGETALMGAAALCILFIYTRN